MCPCHPAVANTPPKWFPPWSVCDVPCCLHPAPKISAFGATIFRGYFAFTFVTTRWLAHHPEDGFVNRLKRFGFPLPLYPSYEVLTFPSVGLSPTEHISLSLSFSGHAGAEYPPRLSSVYASLCPSR